MRYGLILIVVTIISFIGYGADIYVPDDYPSIQGAIDASVNGDTVIVRPGTYLGEIDFAGKAITVRRERGSAATVIDANGGTGVTFRNGEGAGSTLDGFTVTNGNEVTSGGIYCNHSSPTIMRNRLVANISYSGGGIACYDSSPVIVNNTISGNVASYGGGIYCQSKRSSPVILNNTISENRADDGGGIYANYSSPSIANTILWNNSAQNGPEIGIGVPGYPATLTISYSDVKGGSLAVHVEPGSTLNWGAGMIDEDPLFLDAAAGDYHIPFYSPCRSAGDRNAPGLPDTDFEGDPRTGLFAFPDMGADEFHTHFYVKGKVTYGSSPTGVIIGWPGTNPVMLISGSGVLPDPDHTPFGAFWLMPPWDHRVHFNSIPNNGVRFIDRAVSTGLPPGSRIPVQALVGTELSNLWIIEIL